MKYFSIAVSIVLLLIPGLAYADLTLKDSVTLTGSLETLSVDRVKVQEAMNLANSVLCKLDDAKKPAYEASDWGKWFNKFFNLDDHSYTDALADYLEGPAFAWCDPAVQINLQLGLINSLWAKINNITSAHPADLGVAMYNDPSMRQTLYNAHIFFASMAEKGSVDVNARTNIYINYKNYIKTYLQYFSDAKTIDNFEQPFVSLLRAQVWISFVQTLPLGTTRKGEVATTIGIGSVDQTKLDIWNAFTVLVIDNNGLDPAQLNVILNLLNSIPTGLHNLRYVTVRDFLSMPSSWRVILSKGEPMNYNFAIGPDSLAQFSFQDTSGQIEAFSTHNPLTPDTWNHVAVTSGGNEVSMYINGVRDASYAATKTPNAGSSKPLELGRRMSQLQWMRGKLNEVKIYGRVLSTAEINNEYNNKPVSTANLVAYYKMNEPRGTFVLDSSGLKNNGTNVGATIIPGKASGLFFNGKDSYVNVSDSPSLRIAGQITLEAWVYFVKEDIWRIGTGGAGVVNIFGFKVGTVSGNPFPSEVPAVYDETFTSTAAHEFNHIVDSFYVMGDDSRKTRREQLITQAGSSALQYLRSMFVNPDGTSNFPQYPQEFFASIANQYFTDSWNTFDLAIRRFKKGYREPINQFLFFADVYSEDRLETKFYTLDKKGVLTVKNVPIYRDLFGHITEITRTDTNTVYRFILDYKGNVLYYTTMPAKL